ncbi:MAG: hypothetical protein K0A93_01955 [Desulfuromonadaceae bacterium]|nr:hypothetical protein [Desulfuromonadaceae bacterium]
MTSHRLTQKEIALFFFPLVLNVQLMSVSHSIINAILARQDDFITALAGFSVAMVVHLFLASPSYQNHTITIAMVRDRQSLRSMAIFIVLVATYISIMLALVAFTPLGVWLLRDLLGVNSAVMSEAQSVLALLVCLPFFTGFRGLAQGLVIRARRTALVSLATGVRIGALFGFLLLGTRWFSGGQIGAFGLLMCVATESLLIGFFAWRVRLPAEQGKGRTTGEVIRYGLPLAYSSCLQQTIPLLINAIISRMPDGTLALAAFGIVRGFLFLLAGPMRNLQQAYLTLVHSVEDFTALTRFFVRVGIGMGVTVLVLAYPLNPLIFGSLMGVASLLRDYLTLPLALCAIFPLLYGGSNLLRGWFAGVHRTGMLGRSTLLKTGYMLGWWGFLTLVPLPISGALLAVLLLLSAECVEGLYLHRQRNRFLAG